ncbi:uncharacterized protein LOC127350101 isoform X2 [Dicentrarchus labrax]|uniref:uncharacterized protein LOC127350101 isoform X2 n=1 Tax=Dicentrarchus labrax TaxID=13489 RepID=UPI0021F60CB3|nr:uncharacterized protein LOC127350101 isoform X2 [Dicentrarchus labrax]
MQRTGACCFHCSLTNMALHRSILLILTGLTGIHSITTVSEVSVKAGDSITIPCLYESKYINHVKFLCKGYYWTSCSYAVKTNKPSSGKFLISDDKSQRIFTVTINDLTDQDTDYWCAVEIDGVPDVREYFHLSVTRGTPRLYVDHQEITGFKGEKITISCFHRNSGEMKWCRLGSSCMTESSGSIAETRVTITSKVDGFNVTMSNLTTENSGWYLCVSGDFQMPVHVTVTKQLTTNRTLNTTEGQQSGIGSLVLVDLKSLIISLSLLSFTVMVTLVIWFMLKRHKQTKVGSSARTTAEEGVTYSTVKKNRKPQETSGRAEEEVTYSNVKPVRKTSSKV